MLSDRLTPSGTLTDAFGRLRISSPFTLFEITLCAASGTNGADVYAAADWEEITR
jgi:hypothetical protein